MKIRIDNDQWAYCGKVFGVINRKERDNSTAVNLVLEDIETGDVITVVVAKNQIEVVEE